MAEVIDMSTKVMNVGCGWAKGVKMRGFGEFNDKKDRGLIKREWEGVTVGI